MKASSSNTAISRSCEYRPEAQWPAKQILTKAQKSKCSAIKAQATWMLKTTNTVY